MRKDGDGDHKIWNLCNLWVSLLTITIKKILFLEIASLRQTLTRNSWQCYTSGDSNKN